MADRDRAGQRKVRLMTIWVGIGIALMILGVYSSVWVTFLGACVVGSTPVYFTLRAALVPRRATKPPPGPMRGPARTPVSPRPRRPVAPRRRGDDW